MIRYLLDEHVSPKYRTQLLQHEPTLTVWMIGDAGAPPKGTLDPDILCWCERNSFVFVTNNRRSMPQHLTDHLSAGGRVPGVFVMNLDIRMGTILEELILIAGASHEDEYMDQIVHLPLS